MNRSIIWLMVAMAMPAMAQSIETHTAKNVNLTQYQTFTVLQGESVTRADDKIASDKAVFEAIRDGVRRELEVRGYTYVGDSTAQLVVSYVSGSFDLTNAGEIGPLGQTPASDPSQMDQSRSWSNTSRGGLMVIDILDASSKKEVWKAEANNIVLDRADMARSIDAVLYKAFRKFPAKTSQKKKKRK